MESCPNLQYKKVCISHGGVWHTVDFSRLRGTSLAAWQHHVLDSVGKSFWHTVEFSRLRGTSLAAWQHHVLDSVGKSLWMRGAWLTKLKLIEILLT